MASGEKPHERQIMNYHSLFPTANHEPKFEATIMIEETRSITSTGSEINANILLKAGWTLLLVTDRENRDMKWAHFVFGWQMPQDPPEVRLTGVEPTIDI